MKNKLICWLLLMIFVAACGGRSGAGNAAQQNYETVEEGSLSGVTSTLHGPGETLPPITGTNADTTTDFALNPNALPPPGQTIAGGTYPTPQALPPMTSASASPAPQPSVPAPPQTEQARPAPQPEPERAEPTPEEPTPAPSIDTSSTPPPSAEKPKEEPPSPPANDTSGEQAEEPPPPPAN